MEAELQKREVEITTSAQAHFDQQQASHYQEVQAKNLEYQNKLNELAHQMALKEQEGQVRLHEVSQQTELQRQALQETLAAKQAIEINAHQLSITCETERGALNNQASKLQSIIDRQAETVQQFQQRDQDQQGILNELCNQNAQREAQVEKETKS